ncbi:pantetheine-phosphate adenylyltransferase [Candidatus Bealeia paramacronuclearis]
MPHNPLLIGVYPGTFDPVTFGHMDIISRALPLLDKLVIGVAENAGKGPLFSLEERIEILKTEIKSLPNPEEKEISILGFNNLLVQFAETQKARVLVRGLRPVSDFEYEFQMAGTNRKLAPHIETLFLMASEPYQLIASRFVKDVARLGGELSSFVSPEVGIRVREKYN